MSGHVGVSLHPLT